MIEYLNSLPEVLYAEPNGRAVPLAIPSDLRFSEQWGLRNTTNPGADIHAEAAWDIYKGNPNNIIAVIDGGVQTNHVDLDNKISGGDTGFGWDGHGTHVAGIAAAESNNSQGVSGVDWNARLHPQRIDNVADDADTYQAIVDAVNFSPNVHVLNNSWGIVDENDNPGRYSITVRQAFAYAYKANRTSIVAMGNHQQTDPGVVAYPAGFGNVITVGATNNNDVIWNSSAQGSHIDVSAPGVGILSTIDGVYATRSGTSMAAPFVSGIASLLKGYDPGLANDDIENIIKLSADDLGASGFDNEYGFGRVNAEDALKFLEAPYSLSQLTATSGSAVSSTGQSQHVFMSTGSLASGTYIAKRHEVRKNVNFPDDYLNIEGVWGRGVFTTGWNISNPNYGEGFCEVVPGTLTNTGATLRTYVYEVWSVTGSYLGYYPKSPSNVEFAYTVLGVKAPTLTGPANICTTTTYTLNDLPNGASVSWSASSNITIISSSNSEITIKPSSTYTNGEGEITYTINSNYGGYIAVKEVYLGARKPEGLVGVLVDPYIGRIKASVETVPGATGYEWYLDGIKYTGPGMNSAYVTIPIQRNQCNIRDYMIGVRAITQCGTSAQYYELHDNPCYNGTYTYSYAPNPASSEIIIKNTSYEKSKQVFNSLNNTNGSKGAIVIYDFNGAVVQTEEYDLNTQSFRLDVSKLKPGRYFMKIGAAKEEETHQIIIRR